MLSVHTFEVSIALLGEASIVIEKAEAFRLSYSPMRKAHFSWGAGYTLPFWITRVRFALFHFESYRFEYSRLFNGVVALHELNKVPLAVGLLDYIILSGLENVAVGCHFLGPC